MLKRKEEAQTVAEKAKADRQDKVAAMQAEKKKAVGTPLPAWVVLSSTASKLRKGCQQPLFFSFLWPLALYDCFKT